MLGTPIRPPFPPGIRTAVFGLGCFWGAERLFWQTPGVYSTAVGYAGGTTPNPTYEETCTGRTGHTEAVLVAYDPSKVTYDELLRVFWEGHDPTQHMRQGNDVGTQYRSALYWDGADQEAAALASRERYQAALTAAGRGEITTELAPAGTVLLRRGLPPAVPPQGPARLLRPGRHRRELPDRDGRRRGLAGARRELPGIQRPALLDRHARRLEDAADRVVVRDGEDQLHRLARPQDAQQLGERRVRQPDRRRDLVGRRDQQAVELVRGRAVAREVEVGVGQADGAADDLVLVPLVRRRR